MQAFSVILKWAKSYWNNQSATGRYDSWSSCPRISCPTPLRATLKIRSHLVVNFCSTLEVVGHRLGTVLTQEYFKSVHFKGDGRNQCCIAMLPAGKLHCQRRHAILLPWIMSASEFSSLPSPIPEGQCHVYIASPTFSFSFSFCSAKWAAMCILHKTIYSDHVQQAVTLKAATLT